MRIEALIARLQDAARNPPTAAVLLPEVNAAVERTKLSLLHTAPRRRYRIDVQPRGAKLVVRVTGGADIAAMVRSQLRHADPKLRAALGAAVRTGVLKK